MQTVYRVYEGAREPHRLAVERTAEVLLIPTDEELMIAMDTAEIVGK